MKLGLVRKDFKMIRPIITLRRRRIIIDIDTQKDFFLANGAACIRNHRRVIANIRRVIAWARYKNIRMVSTVQVHEGCNGGYCLAGSEGQEKLSYTLRDRYKNFAADGCTDLPREILKDYDQVVLDKRTFDPFDEPRADRVFSELVADEFIIIGAPVEDAVKATALGLLARRKNITILTDAVGAIDSAAAKIALKKIQAKGAKLIETKSLCGASHLQMVGACQCDRCRGKMKKKLVQANS